MLLTGNAILVENSPYDTLWGSGKNNQKCDEYVSKASLQTGLSVHALLSHTYSTPIPFDAEGGAKGITSYRTCSVH